MFFKKKKLHRISRNIKKPIQLFNNKIEIYKDVINIFNNFNFISILINKEILFKIENNFLYFFFFENLKINKLIGTIYSLIKSFLIGLMNFYSKKLTLFGVGYKFLIQSKFLYLYLGFSHPIVYKIPGYVDIELLSLTDIMIKGIDKQKVNLIAGNIKKFKKFDLYKGKGIISDEGNIKLKIFKKK